MLLQQNLLKSTQYKNNVAVKEKQRKKQQQRY